MKKIKLPNGVKIQPISLVDLMEIQASIETEFRERDEPIDVPTYSVPIGDEEQLHEHFHVVDKDGKIEKSTLETDEDFEIWEAHEDAIQRMAGEVALYTTKYMFLEGVEVDWSQYNGWEAKKEKFRIRIPEDEDDKKIYFITSIAFPTPQDQKDCVQAILRASSKGSDPERIEAIEVLFRS